MNTEKKKQKQRKKKRKCLKTFIYLLTLLKVSYLKQIGEENTHNCKFIYNTFRETKIEKIFYAV